MRLFYRKEKIDLAMMIAGCIGTGGALLAIVSAFLKPVIDAYIGVWALILMFSLISLIAGYFCEEEKRPKDVYQARSIKIRLGTKILTILISSSFFALSVLGLLAGVSDRQSAGLASMMFLLYIFACIFWGLGVENFYEGRVPSNTDTGAITGSVEKKRKKEEKHGNPHQVELVLT